MTMIFIAGQAVHDAAQAERRAYVDASGVPFGHGRSEVLCHIQRQQAGRGLTGVHVVKSMYGYSVRYDSGLQDFALLRSARGSSDPSLEAAEAFCREWVARDPARRYAYRTELVAKDYAPGNFTSEQVDWLLRNQWSLLDYLRWLGRDDEQKRLDGWWVGSLTQDLDHWREYGITTALELAAMLDAECEKERRKSQY